MGSRPLTPAPRARPRMDCSSSSVSKTRARPAFLASPRVTPYTPPLSSDVLAEDQRLGVLGQDVRQRPVDGLRERQPALELGQATTEELCPAPGRGFRPRQGCHRGGLGKRQRGHDGPRRREPGKPADLGRQRHHLASFGLVQVEHLVRGPDAGVDEPPGGPDEWVAVQLVEDHRRAPVRRLDVGPRMAHQAHGPQVQERRTAVLPDPRHRAVGCRQRCHQVAAVRLDVLQSWPAPVGGSDPAGGCADTDPDAVVLADEEQRHRDALVAGLDRRVDGPCRRGVVRRGITEAAHGHGVGRPGPLHPELAGALQGQGHAQRPGQVRGDGRGLGDHGEVLAAEDLVAASGDGVLGGGHDAQQHIAQRGRDAALARPLEKERSRTVVQQSRIRDPERRCHGGVAFVPGRPDRVETPALGSQPPGREVQVPAPELGVEDVQAALRGRRGPGGPGLGRPTVRAAAPRPAHPADSRGEQEVDLLGHEQLTVDEAGHAAILGTSRQQDPLVNDGHLGPECDRRRSSCAASSRLSRRAGPPMSRTGRDLPPKAAVVIIGGGVTGLSTAYHLAAAGVRDVVLVERGGVRVRLDLQGRRRCARAVLRPGQHRARDAQPPGVRARSVSSSTRRSTCTRSATCSCSTPPSMCRRSSGASRCRTSWACRAGCSRWPRPGSCLRSSPPTGSSPPRTAPPTGTAHRSRWSWGTPSAARRHGARLIAGCAANGIDTVDGRIVAVDTAAAGSRPTRWSAPPARGPVRSASGWASTSR